VTKLDSSVEKLISEARVRLEKRNIWLENSIEDFNKDLPKHESFPTSKDVLTSYIGIYQNEINANRGILELLGKSDAILLRYDLEN
jgi:phenylalanyl-tRNA synthetase alpha subunit